MTSAIQAGQPISHTCTIPGRCSSLSTLVVVFSLVLIFSGLKQSDSVNEKLSICSILKGSAV